MVIVFYGSKRTVIDLGEYLVKCPSCHTHQWADVMVYSVYNHIYWIPIVPTGKEAFVVCHKCGLKRDKEYFDATLIITMRRSNQNLGIPFIHTSEFPFLYYLY